MISFLLCLAILIVGYFVYGKIVDNTFGPDDRETPAVRINDGVDYVVMPQWKLFLVQLLNIAAPFLFLRFSAHKNSRNDTSFRLWGQISLPIPAVFAVLVFTSS